MQRGEFEADGTVYFEVVKPKPFDMRRLQAGMFADRPDLWQKPRRKQRKAPPPEQQRLF